MLSSAKGRSSLIDEEMHAESFEYSNSYFLQTESLCCTIFESWMLGYLCSILSGKAS